MVLEDCCGHEIKIWIDDMVTRTKQDQRGGTSVAAVQGPCGSPGFIKC